MNFVLQFLLGHDTFLRRNEYVKVTDANTQIKIPAKDNVYCTYTNICKIENCEKVFTCY